MKVELYQGMKGAPSNRRRVLHRAAALGVVGALTVGALPALAQDDVRAEILQIPGVGMGSPTDADWQKVGELTLGPTKENIAEGECKDVELTFMGLNNQNLHNFLFRGFLKPWEDYTGATINWIDLAQDDYNGRLQQAIATGTVDWDIMEMGAPFEGDTAGRGLLDPMPDWVADADRHGRLRRLPEGAHRHLGRRDLPHLDRRRHPHAGLSHRLLRRTRSSQLPGPREGNTDGSEWAPPTTWEQVNAQSKFLAGKTDPLTGPGCLRHRRPAQLPVGRLRLLLPG